MKKLVFYIVIIGINIAFFELIAFGLYKFKYGQYQKKDLQLERIQAINEIRSGSVFTGKDKSQSESFERVREILHPYAGYANEAIFLKHGCDRKAAYTEECYQRQRMPDDGPMPKMSEKTLNVALLGGSVAVGTVNGTPKNFYQTLLSELPEYKGKKVNLHVMAAGGYKQPQPLMMLSYFYSLGAEYDIVIALDGFNEIAVSSSEFKWNKIHPSFPRSWSARVANGVNQDLLKLQAEKLILEQSHVSRARFMSNPICRNSVVSNLIWKVMHRRFQQTASELNQSISNKLTVGDKPRSLEYEKLGPEYLFADWATVTKDSAKIWANSTLAAHGLATSMGAQFFQFIQPNQYIDGAKPIMSEKEKKVAFTQSVNGEYGGYGGWYRMGYPFLKQEQQQLVKMGVNSIDLTYLFKDESKTVYVDNCCHFNKYGYSKIVETIVNKIHETNTQK